MEELQGQILAGRFKLHELIGEGGYGAVFRAEQLSVQRPCAVKVIKTNADMRHDNVIERFKAEAVATSKLHHPNTVVIYDFGEDEESQMLFLAMEYLDGTSLYSLLEDRGTLDLATTLHITNQMAASLQDAHDRRIIHRDIKPHNVMLLERGGELYAKIIDFGIARVIREANTTTMERMTADDTMVGTPYYMAPEQIRDQRVDGRTDMYALAICVYRMLTGRTPFQGGSGIIVASQHLTDRPLPLTAYKPDLEVPRELERVLLKALEKSMDDRYPSIADFAEALNHASGLDVSWSITGAVRVGQRSGKFTPMRSTGPLNTPAPTAEMATTPISDEVKLAIKDDAAFGQTMEASNEEALRAQLEDKWGKQQGPQRSTFMMYPVNVGPDESTARDPGLTPGQPLGATAPLVGQRIAQAPSPQRTSEELLRPDTARLPLDERPGSTLAVPASEVIALTGSAAASPLLPSSAQQAPSPTPALPSSGTETVSTSLDAVVAPPSSGSRKTLIVGGLVTAASFMIVALVLGIALKGKNTEASQAAASDPAAAIAQPTQTAAPESDLSKLGPLIAAITSSQERLHSTAQRSSSTSAKLHDEAVALAARTAAQIKADTQGAAPCIKKPKSRGCGGSSGSGGSGGSGGNSNNGGGGEAEKPLPPKTIKLQVILNPAGYAKIKGPGVNYSGADGNTSFEVGKTYKFEVLSSAFGDVFNRGSFTVQESNTRVILPRAAGQSAVVK